MKQDEFEVLTVNTVAVDRVAQCLAEMAVEEQLSAIEVAMVCYKIANLMTFEPTARVNAD